MKRLMLLGLLVPLVAGAQQEAAEQEVPGAVMTPTVLPEGDTAMAVWLGVPAVGASYRWGLAGGTSEAQARVRLDYLLLSARLEGAARRQMGWAQGLVVPELGGGLVLNSGSRYAFGDNFRGVFLRLDPALVFSQWLEPDSWRREDMSPRAVLRAALPFELGLNPLGAWRWMVDFNAGLEFSLRDTDLSFLLLVEFGGGSVKEPGKELRGEGFAGLRLGVGLRQF
jgi:hypothetical protein